MSSQPLRSYLVIAAAIVIAGVLISASLFVAIGGAKTTTSTTTTTVTTTAKATYLFGSNVTLQVARPTDIPGDFAVGDYLINDTWSPPCVTPNEASCSQLSGTSVSFEIDQNCPPSLSCAIIPPQNASFSWPGGFSAALPAPANATMFGGFLHIDWTVQDGSLLLTVRAVPSVFLTAARLYQVTFQETGSCGIIPTVYQAPWSVTLGGWTEASPANASLPISNTEERWSSAYVNYSSIVFSLPSGIYSYTVTPNQVLYPTSGNVAVSGADVMVAIHGPSFLCP